MYNPLMILSLFLSLELIFLCIKSSGGFSKNCAKSTDKIKAPTPIYIKVLDKPTVFIK